MRRTRMMLGGSSPSSDNPDIRPCREISALSGVHFWTWPEHDRRRRRSAGRAVRRAAQAAGSACVGTGSSRPLATPRATRSRSSATSARPPVKLASSSGGRSWRAWARQRWLSVGDPAAALGEPDDGAAAVARVRRPLGDALPLEPVDQRGRRAAGQLQVAGELGLAPLAVQREGGDRLALGGAEADRVGHRLPVVLGGHDQPAQVADGVVELVVGDAVSWGRGRREASVGAGGLATPGRTAWSSPPTGARRISSGQASSSSDVLPACE